MVLMQISMKKVKVFFKIILVLSFGLYSFLFFLSSFAESKRPFAEIALLRGDINRGKLPLGWNMVKALHAPWVTPIKGSDGSAFYICYRRASKKVRELIVIVVAIVV